MLVCVSARMCVWYVWKQATQHAGVEMISHCVSWSSRCKNIGKNSLEWNYSPRAHHLYHQISTGRQISPPQSSWTSQRTADFSGAMVIIRLEAMENFENLVKVWSETFSWTQNSGSISVGWQNLWDLSMDGLCGLKALRLAALENLKVRMTLTL